MNPAKHGWKLMRDAICGQEFRKEYSDGSYLDVFVWLDGHSDYERYPAQRAIAWRLEVNP